MFNELPARETLFQLSLVEGVLEIGSDAHSAGDLTIGVAEGLTGGDGLWVGMVCAGCQWCPVVLRGQYHPQSENKVGWGLTPKALKAKGAHRTPCARRSRAVRTPCE